MSNVVHLTSVHDRYDTRIFLKMCRSLAAAGHSVTLVVADGRGDETRDDVRILDVGKPSGRRDRMTRTTRQVLARAVGLSADIYHLHDPELLFAGLALKRRGRRVVFDAHEDLPAQVMSKAYLHPAVRKAISRSVAVLEHFTCRRLDAVVAATPVIAEKFARMGATTVNVNNYPLLGELDALAPWDRKRREVCYVGGMFATRGIRELVAAMDITQSGARLLLAGRFEPGLRDELVKTPGWANVEELGYLDRGQVRDVLSRSVAGLVTLHPTPAYHDSLPVKMFEYMSAGLPVIASDFPLWREIVEGNNCGVCVDPKGVREIAAAIDHLVSHEDLAQSMGKNGSRAVHERYNWSIEEKKLLALYDQLLAR